MGRVGRPPGQTGFKQTAESRKRISTEQATPMADRIARDRELLDALGETQTWEFAQHMGCSEQTAKNRLRRLFERGLAERRKERGRIGWTYTAKR